METELERIAGSVLVCRKEMDMLMYWAHHHFQWFSSCSFYGNQVVFFYIHFGLSAFPLPFSHQLFLESFSFQCLESPFEIVSGRVDFDSSLESLKAYKILQLFFKIKGLIDHLKETTIFLWWLT